MTMRNLKLKAVLVTAAVGLGALAMAACGKNGEGAQPAAPGLGTPSAATSPATSPAPATPSAPPPTAATPTAATPTGDRPQVTLTEDPVAASNELVRLRKAGWFNPNKIEYADDAVIALQQFKRWLDAGYIARDGGWTPEGLAAVERANKSGTPL
ncbi:hypothetical protein [Streptomyces sp. NPDC059874]|uniref:hypothetical protein n=1 Tax=Streptomyces sp. NPDC059874 TaxID=3346983 RepID=UPI00364E1E9C